MKKNAPEAHAGEDLWELERHPLSYVLFGFPSEHQYEMVRELYDERDVQVEVLTDGTVIHGFDLLDASLNCGSLDFDVVVREDLERSGEQAIIQRITEDLTWKNYQSPIEAFRCRLVRYGHLKTLE